MIDLAASLHEQRYCQSAEGCVKTRSDLTRYRRLFSSTPSPYGDGTPVILETGTFSGKSAIWFRRHAGRVVTIDVHDQVDDATRCECGGIEWIVGSSVDPEIVSRAHEAIRLLGGDNPTMVVLDSWHGRDHVLAEMEAYADLVTPGCYMVVEDTIVRWCPAELLPEGPYDGSPLDAVETFMRRHPGMFVVDDEIENMLPTTQHPSGWLRRVS